VENALCQTNEGIRFRFFQNTQPDWVVISSAAILQIKPRPKDRNISMQHIATLLAQYLQAPAKR